jgi:multidrug efflux pump subunit AcrA (membrane-fusion protein)
VRTSASIDAVTRTMQVEIALPNKDGILLPGAFVQVSLPLQPSGVMTIPTNALMIRAEGPRAAAVGADGRVSLRPLRIGRNYGQSIEVLDGVTEADRLVLNPPDSLNEGDTVTVVAARDKEEKKK